MGIVEGACLTAITDHYTEEGWESATVILKRNGTDGPTSKNELMSNTNAAPSTIIEHLTAV